jgi:hypothetical protein
MTLAQRLGLALVLFCIEMRLVLMYPMDFWPGMPLATMFVVGLILFVWSGTKSAQAQLGGG